MKINLFSMKNSEIIAAINNDPIGKCIGIRKLCKLIPNEPDTKVILYKSGISAPSIIIATFFWLNCLNLNPKIVPKLQATNMCVVQSGIYFLLIKSNSLGSNFQYFKKTSKNIINPKKEIKNTRETPSILNVIILVIMISLFEFKVPKT